MLMALGAIAGLGISAYQSYQSGETAKKGISAQQSATQASIALGREQLETANYRYQRWQEIFGPIEKNLSSYYQSLDPKDFQARMGTTLEESYATAQKRLSEQLSQRGIQGSGIEVAARTQLAESFAETQAQLPFAAEQQVAQQQAQFYAMGQGQQANLMAQQQGGYGALQQATQYGGAAMTQMYGQQAQGQLQQAAEFGQVAGYLAANAPAFQPGQANQAQLPQVLPGQQFPYTMS